MSPFLGTRISSASGFGKTVTGTLTVSVNLPLSYVTGTSTLTSVTPAFPAVSGNVVGSPFVPSVPGTFTGTAVLSPLESVAGTVYV